MLGKNFIHYYDDVDEVMSVLENGESSIMEASYAYEEAKRIGEQKIFFEECAQDEIDLTLEAAENNVFATIGKAVMAALSTFKKFLEDFITFLTDKFRGAETDKDKINKILKDHPDLKDQVVLSLEKGVLSYKDIASFEKDYLGLVQLLQSGKLDELTFKDKATKAIEKFDNSAKIIAGAGLTVVALIGILPKLIQGIGDAKNSIVRANQSMGKLKNEIDKNQIKDQGRLRATMNALKTYVGITTTEYKKQKTYADKATGRLHWLANSKPGQWLARKEAESQNKAYDRQKAKEAAAKKSEDDEYNKQKSAADRLAEDDKNRKVATKQALTNIEVTGKQKINQDRNDSFAVGNKAKEESISKIHDINRKAHDAENQAKEDSAKRLNDIYKGSNESKREHVKELNKLQKEHDKAMKKQQADHEDKMSQKRKETEAEKQKIMTSGEKDRNKDKLDTQTQISNLYKRK
jgi:hypothetical protein